VVLVVSRFFDQLFEVHNVLIDVRPGHAQGDEFVPHPEFLLGVHELSAELGDKLVICVLVVRLIGKPPAHVVPPCGCLRSFDMGEGVGHSSDGGLEGDVLVIEEEVVSDFVYEFLGSGAVSFKMDGRGTHESFSVNGGGCLLSCGLSSCRWWVSASSSSWVSSGVSSSWVSSRISSSWVSSGVSLLSPQWGFVHN
jgi:hypothetical protein